MYTQRFLLTVLICSGIGLINLFGQTSIGTAGGDTSGPGGTVGYSIGQVVYANFSNESGSINQGVQQPYDIIMVSTTNPAISLNATIFPNPTTTAIQLILDELVFSSGTHVFTYTLYDLSGRLLQQDEITASTTLITLEKLVGTVYLLRISDNNKIVKSFKIFKTN